MMRGAPPQQSQPPPPNTVLLTHLPSFLHSVRAIREWIGPCGNSRTVLFVPPVQDPGNTDMDILAELTGDTGTSSTNITALVTLSHADAAAKLIAAFRHFQQQLSATSTEEAGAFTEEAGASTATIMEAYLVPNHPDIPLKPVHMDPEVAQVLGDKLMASYLNISLGKSSAATNTNAMDTTTTSTTAPTPMDITKPKGPEQRNDNDDDQQDDDDDQQDPLTTPVVLSAVRDFRRRLEQQQGSKSTRRKELVALQLQEMMPLMKQRIVEEASRPAAAAAPPPPPPPAGGPPPMPTGNLPPPPPQPSAAESSQRGVSNLPAWMTKQGAPDATAEATTEATQEPPAKKPRLEVPSLEGNTEQKFPAMDVAHHEAVKEAIAAQCVQSLGEPVPTLVDFIYKHVTEQSLVSVVLLEVQEVLEDEAAQFVQTLWEKVHALAASV
jgi:hypothetical protein